MQIYTLKLETGFLPIIKTFSTLYEPVLGYLEFLGYLDAEVIIHVQYLVFLSSSSSYSFCIYQVNS